MEKEESTDKSLVRETRESVVIRERERSCREVSEVIGIAGWKDERRRQSMSTLLLFAVLVEILTVAAAQVVRFMIFL